MREGSEGKGVERALIGQQERPSRPRRETEKGRNRTTVRRGEVTAARHMGERGNANEEEEEVKQSVRTIVAKAVIFVYV